MKWPIDRAFSKVKIEEKNWIHFHIIYFSLRKSLIFFLQLLADIRLEMGRMILNLYFNIFVLVYFYVKLHTSPQCWKCIGIPLHNFSAFENLNLCPFNDSFAFHSGLRKIYFYFSFHRWRTNCIKIFERYCKKRISIFWFFLNPWILSKPDIYSWY